MTILALDLGTKNIGVAISHGVMAEAWKTISYKSQREEDLFKELNQVIAQQKVEKVLIGLPLGRDGKPTRQSRWTKELGNRIARATQASVEYVEESFSSNAAGEINTDQEAARIILEQYLNEAKSS